MYATRRDAFFTTYIFLLTTRFLMENVSIPDPSLAETQMALQEIRDLPAALFKNTFDPIIPADRVPPATFWVPYNDEERNIRL
jgi:hypothetical protein